MPIKDLTFIDKIEPQKDFVVGGGDISESEKNPFQTFGDTH
jgi:hypothetical protein